MTFFDTKAQKEREAAYTNEQLQAYRALSTAAERIGANNFTRSGCKPHFCRGRWFDAYYPTQAHKDIVSAMSNVLNETITPEEAMNLLRRGDILEQRTWRKNEPRN